MIIGGGILRRIVLYRLRLIALDLHNDTLNPLKLHRVFSVTTDQLRYAAIEPVRNLFDCANVAGAPITLTPTRPPTNPLGQWWPARSLEGRVTAAASFPNLPRTPASPRARRGS
jgi:hypothetical protein